MNPTATIPELTEAQVRELRDAVYENKISDTGWDNCKQHWLSPAGIEFLIDSAPTAKEMEEREKNKNRTDTNNVADNQP